MLLLGECLCWKHVCFRRLSLSSGTHLLMPNFSFLLPFLLDIQAGAKAAFSFGLVAITSILSSLIPFSDPIYKHVISLLNLLTFFLSPFAPSFSLLYYAGHHSSTGLTSILTNLPLCPPSIGVSGRSVYGNALGALV